MAHEQIHTDGFGREEIEREAREPGRVLGEVERNLNGVCLEFRK